jgi:hypothetical protein
MIFGLFASMPVLFSLTLFLSAGLLFLVEPMIAKMILPLLGGTPAVWNTCMMFFQAVLLAGYGYAHILSRNTGVSRQIVIHLLLFVSACLVLPIAIPQQWVSSAEANPIGYILLLLMVSVGLPFFVLSSTGILLQKWFAGTDYPSARDAYFLYSASNLGSMLALIAYPTLIEPYFRLAEQSRFWTIGYALLLACTVFCAVLTRKNRLASLSQDDGHELPAAEGCNANEAALTPGKMVRLVLLSFVPSSLMLGVTTFLSTDVAAIPLFWVIPLSLYLLSFIIVFARIPALIHRSMILILPVTVTCLIFVNFSDIGIPKWIVFIFHLVNFFVYSMVCHGEIAGSRPATKHLTEYYLLISLGGALGGIFNALIAPIAFNTILEYPLILVLGALLLPVVVKNRRQDLLKWKYAILYLAVPILLALLTYWFTIKLPLESINLGWLTDALHMRRKTIELTITYGFLGLLCFGLIFFKKPFLFGIGIAAMLMTTVLSKDFTEGIVYRERSFFGVLTVTKDADGEFMSLFHGTTLHGKQRLDPDRRFEPLAYYHRRGPAGQVFSEFSGERQKASIAITGLGTGTLAAYGWPGQEIDYYEIDAAVKRIATNPVYFSFLSGCEAKWRIILGDARLTMEKAPGHYYGIIILDAFSSDAIPVHLLTREAVSLYFSKLREDGVLLIHISNRYINLEPVLAKLAEENGYAGIICSIGENKEIERYGSTWVLLARSEADFGGLARSKDWEKIELQKNVKVWTDDFSNLLSVFKW